MSLSDAKVRNAKPKDKAYKLYDGEGMFLLVHSNGGKYWRFKYSFGGKERGLAFGVYPDVGLAAARERRAEARTILASGNDPGLVRQANRAATSLTQANTFEAIAREWHGKRKSGWVDSTSRITMKRLELHIFPSLGKRPIAEITAPELLTVVQRVEKMEKLETARRLMQICGKVFMYAIATARAQTNPVPYLRGALKTPVTKHHSHLKASELPTFLRKLKLYDGEPLTKLALQLLTLTFVRTTELRAARWTEINLKSAEWRIPEERMKMKTPHIVPLSRQAIATLKEIQKHSGKREFIFPNQHNQSSIMSENTMLFALYRMGYRSRTTGHGVRSTASTILNENRFSSDVIERQLAHCERNTVRAAYNHAQYLPERRKMMQWWADYLEKAAKKRAVSTS